jgi:hypothetical protein
MECATCLFPGGAGFAGLHYQRDRDAEESEHGQHRGGNAIGLADVAQTLPFRLRLIGADRADTPQQDRR